MEQDNTPKIGVVNSHITACTCDLCYLHENNYGYITTTILTQPYKCPICEGKGIVPGGFYHSVGPYSTSNLTTEQCRSCNGKGVIEK